MSTIRAASPLAYAASPGRTLGSIFLTSATRNPARVALVVGDETLSYEQLAKRAGQIAALLSTPERRQPAIGAVLGGRTSTTYAAVLGTLLSGAGYVPLNPKFPDDRNAFMLSTSGASSLVVDEECVPKLERLLALVTLPLTVVVPHAHLLKRLASTFPLHTFRSAEELENPTPVVEPPAVTSDAIAYLLFTSGSTGAPKGVMVSHRNALHHLDVVWERYRLDENDRVSQTFDLTFDLSVFDIFAALGSGASLHVVPAKTLLAPAKFIKERALTVWFSVPSVAMMMRSYNLLQPGSFPSLRLSLFCGERLPSVIANEWQAAAPASRVENLYGPTEVTIACTRYVWKGEESLAECVDGVVPIGSPYPGMAAAIVNANLGLVRAGEKGELCMSGPQVSPGYWLDPEKTTERYVAMPWASGPENRWYRTGDIAYMQPDGTLIHCGRNDDQVKIHGHRIELGEIEHVLRRAAQTDFVAVIVRSRNGEGSVELVAAVARTTASPAEITREVAKSLPAYMVPQRIMVVADLPLNANGKIDKKGVAELFDKIDKVDVAP